MNIEPEYKISKLSVPHQDAVRNSEHLRLINEVSYSITSILDLDELLRAVVTSIQRAFGYYYVGLSLVENDCLSLVIDGQVVGPAGYQERVLQTYHEYPRPEEMLGICRCRTRLGD